MHPPGAHKSIRTAAVLQPAGAGYTAGCAHVHPDGGWCSPALVRVPWFVTCCARSAGLRHPVALVAWHLSVFPGCGWRRASPICLAASRGAPRLVRSGGSRCSGPLSQRLGAFPHTGGFRSGFSGRLRGARGRRPRTGLIVPAAGPRQGGTAGLALRRTSLGPRDGIVPGRSLRCRSGRCTGAGSCGRRHRHLQVAGRNALVPCVSARARASWPGRAAWPPGRVLVCLTLPLAASSFCFPWPPPGWVCPFLGLLFAFPFFYSFSSLSLHPPVSCFLLFPAPPALGLGAVCRPPPFFFSFLFLVSCFSLWPACFAVSFLPVFCGFVCLSSPPHLFCGSPAARLSVRSLGCSRAVAAPSPPWCVFHSCRRCRSVFRVFCPLLCS